MDSQRKLARIMQELLDEITPAYTRLLQDRSLPQDEFDSEYEQILEDNVRWLVERDGCVPAMALCSTITVVRLIRLREGLEAACSIGDAAGRRMELATVVVEEVGNHTESPFSDGQVSDMHRYVVMLLTRYGHLRESCGSLFESDDYGTQCLPNPRPKQVKNLKTMEVWKERDVMEMLCGWVLKDYERARLRFPNPERLQDEWSYRLVERSYNRLTDYFNLRLLRALSMVQVAGYFVRQHLAIDPAPRGNFAEHEELAQAEDLTTSVVCDLDPKTITDQTRSRVFTIVTDFLVAYRGEGLIRRRRRQQ